MVAGSQPENCSLRSTPSAAAACSAPVWRASVAPSPALPPICMYMTRPLPIGSSAKAVPAPAIIAAAAAPARRSFFMLMFSSSQVGPPRVTWRGLRASFGRTCPVEAPYLSHARKEGCAALGLVDEQVENDRD